MWRGKYRGEALGLTAAELWVIADVARVRDTIARCRQDPAARSVLGEEFMQAYATFSTGNTSDYWNRYLTWVVVQTLAIERWPDLPYSLRNAAAFVLRYLNEAEEDAGSKGVLARWRRSRPMREAVPQVTATMQLLATLGGAAAESRADALSPGVDPTYTEEGALYFDDAECQEVLASLPLLRAFFIDAPYGPQFHFWAVRQPGLSRTMRDALTLPNRFLGDIETVFTHAQNSHAQVFVLWAP